MSHFVRHDDEKIERHFDRNEVKGEIPSIRNGLFNIKQGDLSFRFAPFPDAYAGQAR